MAIFTGTPFGDLYFGTPEDDEIRGGGGADDLFGAEGDDWISGQDGNDTIEGNDGSDVIYGGSGDDKIIGDSPINDASQTSIDEGTLVSGVEVTTTLRGPERTGEARTVISGTIGQNVPSSEVNVAFVIDVSGSMGALFSGGSVPDQNGNGFANELIDGAIASFRALNDAIIAAGFSTAQVTIIPFSDSASTLLTTLAAQDTDGDGETDISQALGTLAAGGLTNYEAALQQAVTFFGSQPVDENNFLFFLSDGVPTTGGALTDEVTALQGLGVVREAVGLGTGSSLADLNLIDSGGAAIQVTDPDALTADLLGSPISEGEVDRVEIRVNGVLVATIAGADLISTFAGLSYELEIDLEVGASDLVESTVFFVDGSTFVNEIQIDEPFPGDDYINAGSGDDQVSGNEGDDTLLGASGDDSLAGNSGDDVLNGGSGNDWLEGGIGEDSLVGGSGIDTASYRNANGPVFVSLEEGRSAGADGRDRIWTVENIDGSDFNDTLRGDEFDNAIAGNGGNDNLFGLAGNDTLLGGAGDDRLTAGDGTDQLSGGPGNDTFFIAGEGEGTIPSIIEDFAGEADRIDMDGAGGGAVFDMATGGVVDGRYWEIASGGTFVSPLDLIFAQDVSGSYVDDLPTVVGLIPTLTAAVEAINPDTRFALTTFSDKPVSPFGTSIDTPYSTVLSLTDDAVVFGGAYAGVTLQNGNDTPESQLEALLQIAVRGGELGFDPGATKVVVLFTDAEFHQAGDFATAPPNNGDDVLDGLPPGSGEDYPDVAQVQAALLAAGIVPVFAVTAGQTTTYNGLVADLGFGTVVELASDSSNIVAAITAALNFVTDQTVIEELIATDFDDSITGNAADNLILGEAGNDTLLGVDGDDEIFGGAGNDLLGGGNGNDTLAGGLGADQIFGGAGVDTASYDGYAINLIISLLTNTASDGDVLNSIENVAGGAGDDSIVGSAGANTLIGNNGNDTITAGDGDDLVRGNEGDDSISGEGGDDTLEGANGNDWIGAADGNDEVFGESGNDTVFGGAGNDIVSGGDGNDFGRGNDGDDTVFGDLGDDTMFGSIGNDTVDGGDGDDLLFGEEGNDSVLGGAGNDLVNGGVGVDTLGGGDGDDTLIGGSGADVIFGGLGTNDVASFEAETVGVAASLTTNVSSQGDTFNGVEGLTGGSGNDTLTGSGLANAILGGGGNDTLDGVAGDDTLEGGDGNDSVLGGDGNDVVRGGNGVDTLGGGAGNDTVDGGAGADALFGGVGTDTATFAVSTVGITASLVTNTSSDGDTFNSIENLDGSAFNDAFTGDVNANQLAGNAGNDSLLGGDGNDSVLGGDGDDTLGGGNGNDTVEGGAGNDRVFGGLNNDSLFGGDGNDSLDGSDGNDFLLGEAGLDTLIGGLGNDTLNGGIGNDTMTGNAGLDVFRYVDAFGGAVDVITDFNPVDDQFVFRQLVTPSVPLGALAATAFTIGVGATTAAHRFVYNNLTGDLFFDADGVGGGAQVQFADLTAGLGLTAADFFIIA